MASDGVGAKVLAGLRAPGVGPVGQRSSLLECCLEDEHLGNEVVEELARFPRLQKLDLRGNGLSDLRGLRALRQLREVDASDNDVLVPLDWEPTPLEREEDEMDDDAFAVTTGSLVEVARFSHNGIATIPDLSRHALLQELALDGNFISDMGAGLRSLQHLRVLSLAGNQIHTVTGLDELPLEVLNLSDNNISRITGLNRLRWLRRLDLHGNNIKALGPCLLTEATLLTWLDLRDNQIADMAQLSFLTPCGHLQTLDCRGNPVTNTEGYRLRTLFRVQSLELLDDAAVASEELVEAVNLHGCDVAARKARFEELLPEVEFENTQPPLEDATLGVGMGPLYVGGRRVGRDYVFLRVVADPAPENLGGFVITANSPSWRDQELRLSVSAEEAGPGGASALPAAACGSGGGGGKEDDGDALVVEEEKAGEGAAPRVVRTGIVPPDPKPVLTAARLARRVVVEVSEDEDGRAVRSLTLMPSLPTDRDS